jgi:hypothetical protein
MVNGKRALQPTSAGGLALWDIKVRLMAFKANMIEKIRFNSSMKVSQIWKDKLDVHSPNFWKVSQGNSLIDELIDCWKKFHTPESDVSEYKTIKTLQSSWKPDRTPKWTPKQTLMTNSTGAENIFTTIKKLKWRRLAFFAWKYFQGALVFPRSKCDCNTSQGKNSHAHVLFECPIGDFPWSAVEEFADHFSDNQIFIQNEYDIWHLSNDANTPVQIIVNGSSVSLES